MRSQELNVLRWTAYPAVERPARTFIGIAVIACIAATIYLSAGWPWTVGAVLVLLFSLNRFFLPSRFKMDDDRIIARYPLRKRVLHWRDVRRFVSDANGGYLSTRSRRSLMDPSSGMHLLFGGNPTQREQIIQSIKSRVNAQAAPFDEPRSVQAAGSVPGQKHAMARGGSACRD